MSNIRNLTESYVSAFNARALDAVVAHFADEFALTDPEVTALTPKAAVRDYIGGLFEAYPGLTFTAHRIVADGQSSVIHFTLVLGDTVLDGVDVIEWSGEQMTSMHAYLTARPESE